MPGEVLGAPRRRTRSVCTVESAAGSTSERPEPRREEAVETLRYALNGFLSAIRADRAGQAGPLDVDADGTRYRLLAALADELDLDNERLARVLGLSGSAVRDLLDVHGREGLVEAVRAGRGRGGSVVRLTPAGRRELYRLDALFRESWESAFADLPAEELRTAARVLSRLSGVLVAGR
ncbi:MULTISPECIES: MarR family winged helix-turn-helix transcriptional regulator [unclassified Embleya]|uniref:MarR family winged helix-turn-helix transcriptional regulator n=1 Tax=unclassified Embleya TaxID=2699296 RepID=UPI0033F3287C